jgi:hypothetical protein
VAPIGPSVEEKQEHQREEDPASGNKKNRHVAVCKRGLNVESKRETTKKKLQIARHMVRGLTLSRPRIGAYALDVQVRTRDRQGANNQGNENVRSDRRQSGLRSKALHITQFAVISFRPTKVQN